MNKQMELFPGGLCWGEPHSMEVKYNAIKAGRDTDFILYGDSGFDAAVDMMGDALTDDERDYL